MKEVSKDRSNIAASRAKQMPEGVQYAIVSILPNIVNGAFWGFTDYAGVADHVDAIRDAGQNLAVRKLGNACLIEANPQYLVSAVAQIDPSAITTADLNKMRDAMAQAEIGFEKWLISKAKTKPGAQPFGGTIGIYCINDVSTISYRGVNYPAFRVNMPKALALLARYGFKVKVAGQFVDGQTAMASGQALWSSVTLSPTKTGLFIDVQSTFSNDQVKALESQFKARYGLK